MLFYPGVLTDMAGFGCLVLVFLSQKIRTRKTCAA